MRDPPFKKTHKKTKTHTHTPFQVLFCKLTARQRALYRAVLGSPEIRLILEGKASHFRAITMLRKVGGQVLCVCTFMCLYIRMPST